MMARLRRYYPERSRDAGAAWSVLTPIFPRPVHGDDRGLRPPFRHS